MTIILSMHYANMHGICDQKEHRNSMPTGRLEIRKAKPVIKMRGAEIKTTTFFGNSGDFLPNSF